MRCQHDSQFRPNHDASPERMHVTSHACCDAEHGACVLHFNHCRHALKSKGILFAVAQRTRRLYDGAISRRRPGIGLLRCGSVGRDRVRSMRSGYAPDAPAWVDREAWGPIKR